MGTVEPGMKRRLLSNDLRIRISSSLQREGSCQDGQLRGRCWSGNLFLNLFGLLRIPLNSITSEHFIFFSSPTSYSIIFSTALHSCLRVNKRKVLWSVDLK